MKKVLTSVWLWLGVGLAVGAVIFVVATSGSDVRELRLDQFLTRLEDGQVRSATVLGRSNAVVGELRSGQEYRSEFPVDYSQPLTDRLLDAGIRTSGDSEAPSGLETFLYDLLPTLIVVGVFLWFIMQMQNGGRSSRFGRAKARKARNRRRRDLRRRRRRDRGGGRARRRSRTS